MKKSLFFLTICLSLFIFSCYDFTNIELPETVSISSRATYQLPAGTMSFNLKKEMGAEKLREILNENMNKTSESVESEGAEAASAMMNSFEVYQYEPKNGGDVFCYIINYPIKEIPLSLSSGGINNGGKGENYDLDITENIEIPDLLGTITAAIEGIEIESQSISIPELGQSVSISQAIESAKKNDPNFDTKDHIYFNIESPEFKTMKLKSGKLRVNFQLDGSSPSSDFKMLISLSLCSGAGNVISKNDAVDCTWGGDVYLDLNGAELEKNMEIKIDGSLEGGELSKVNNYKISFELEDGFEVAKITGLTLADTPEVPIDNSFLLSENNALKEATIKKGEAGLVCELPEGWSGISCNEETYLSITGMNFDDDTANVKPSDLIRKSSKLEDFGFTSKEEIKVDGKLSLSINDATIEFHDKDELNFRFYLNIEEIGKISINLADAMGDLSKGETIETGFNLSSLLGDVFDGDDKTELIKNIKFPENSENSENLIEAYLYITQPTENEALKKLGLTGKVEAQYKIKVGEEYKDHEPVPLAKLDSKTLPVSNYRDDGTEITFKLLAEENEEANGEKYTIVSDELFKEGTYTAKLDAMTQIFNDTPDELNFYYEVGVDGTENIELDGDDFKKLKESGGIKISLAIKLPLAIVFDDVTDDNSETKGTRDNEVTVDNILEMTGNAFDDDLLKREEGTSDFDDFKDKYSDIFKNIKLSYMITNTTPLKNLIVTFQLQTRTANGDMIAIDGIKEQPLVTDTKGEYFYIEFTQAEILKMIDTCPIMPVVKVEITGADGQTVKQFARDALIDFKANLTVETDGTIKVWDKNK